MRFPLILVMVAVLAATGQAATIGRVIVTADQAPVIQGKETIASAKKGDALDVSEVKGDWYGVLPTRGWIHKSNVRFEPAAVTVEPSAPAAPAATNAAPAPAPGAARPAAPVPAADAAARGQGAPAEQGAQDPAARVERERKALRLLGAWCDVESSGTLLPAERILVTPRPIELEKSAPPPYYSDSVTSHPDRAAFEKALNDACGTIERLGPEEGLRAAAAHFTQFNSRAQFCIKVHVVGAPPIARIQEILGKEDEVTQKGWCSRPPPGNWKRAPLFVQARDGAPPVSWHHFGYLAFGVAGGEVVAVQADYAKLAPGRDDTPRAGPPETAAGNPRGTAGTARPAFVGSAFSNRPQAKVQQALRLFGNVRGRGLAMHQASGLPLQGGLGNEITDAIGSRHPDPRGVSALLDVAAAAARYGPAVHLKKHLTVESGTSIERVVSVLGKEDFVQTAQRLVKLPPLEGPPMPPNAKAGPPGAQAQVSRPMPQEGVWYHFGWLSFGTIDGDVVSVAADYHAMHAEGPPAGARLK